MKRIIGLYFLLLSCFSLSALDNTSRNVLILHSYHSEFSWTENINKAIISSLQDYDSEIQISVEYMDTKNFPLPEIRKSLLDLYEKKYGKQKPDLLILSDNNALEFALDNRKDLFKNVPIIFTGINYYTREILRGEKNITGVAEGTDITGCLQFIRNVQPDVSELVIVADNTVTGKMNYEKFNKDIKKFRSLFSVRELVGLTDSEVIEVLESLPPSSAVFYLSFFQDRFGHVRSMKDNIEILVQNSTVPVYVLWDWAMPFGAFGGVVTSGHMQGITAGKMAVDILGGIPADSIPVTETSPTEIMVNYLQAEKYKINFKLFPEETIFISPPSSFYHDHKILVTVIAGVILFLLGAVLTLLVLMQKSRLMSAEINNHKRLLHDIITNIPHPVYWKNGNLIYEGCNDSFADLVGFSSPEEIPGKSDEDFPWSEEQRSFFNKCDNSVLITKTPMFNIEESVRSSDGGNKTFFTSKVPLIDAKGDVSGILGISIDISERKDAEEKLAASESQYRALYDNALVGLVRIIYKKGNIVNCNQKFAGMFGYQTKEECISSMNSVNQFVNPDERLELIEKIDRTGEAETEIEMYRPDGSRLWISMTIKKQPDEDILDIATLDISDRKKAETEREMLEDQLRQSEKLQAIGQLAGGVAHDFNNQLGVMLGYAEILKAVLKNHDKEIKLLENIFFAINQSKDLTAKLLAFSRKGKNFEELIDLYQVITDVCAMLEHSIDKKIKIENNVDSGKAVIIGDSSQIYNAILNVGINARDAMPDGGTICFETNQVFLDPESIIVQNLDVEGGEYFCVSITDTGEGMSEEIQSKVFEPFFTTKEEGKGTGMGLPAVYGTMKVHKGAVRIYSEPGEGTSIKLYFQKTDKQGELVSKPDKPIENFDCKGHVLLIDDNELIGQMGDELLSYLGFDVTVYNNPLEAISFYRNNSNVIKLVILDMIMPEMNGSEVFIELKKINPEIRVILSSGYTLNGEAQKILEKGVKGFIQKPFTIQQLSSEIKKVCG